MRLSVSTRRGWFLSIVALAAIALPAAPAAFAQDPPEILDQPESAEACDGGMATFSVVAIGDPPLDYQWYRDGERILDATQSSYEIDPVGPGAGADYTVIVSNGFGAVESDPATLTVLNSTSPTITIQPVSQEVCDGDGATFEVTADGDAPLSYQWRRNGVSIFGATEASYTINPVGPDAGADFSVVVTNATLCASIESDVVTLTVREGPIITEQPQEQTPCEGGSFELRVTATGYGTLLYQWRMDGQDLVDDGHVLGAQSDTLEISGVTAADAGDYDVVLTDDCDVSTSSIAAVTVRVGPSILMHPDDDVACVGQPVPVEFAVLVTGSMPLFYQWWHDGALIPGATGATYWIEPVTQGAAGDYYVVVSNDCNLAGVQSDTATLTVNLGPAISVHPQSQVACSSDPNEVIVFSVTATGTDPLTYQWRKNGNMIPGAESDTYTISPVTVGDAGSYDVAIANLCGFELSDVATLAVVSDVPTIAEQPQGAARCDNGAESITFSVSATPADGLMYQWRKDGVDILDATADTYEIPVVTTADAGDYDVIVSNPCGPTQSELATLQVADAWPEIVEQPEGDLVCEGQSVTFDVTAQGPEPLSYQWHFGGTPIDGEINSWYTIDDVDSNDAGDYRVLVSNPCGDVMSAPATLTVIDDAPSIAEQPQPVIACEGATVAFTVVSAGDPPFEYQWYRDGIVLDGAIGESYTAEDITVVDDAGEYSVVVRNACDPGGVQSETATLTVNTAVEITLQPVEQTLCETSAVTFTVEVSGTAPYSYQWRKDGAEIDGATGAEYAIASIAPADAGAYDVVVTNLCGSATSAAAVLTVDVGPTITQQPAAPELCVGETVELTVEATGDGTLTYQWYKDNAPLAGETAATLTITGLTTDHSGQYHAVVTNHCEQAASDSATVVVDEPPLITAQPAAAIIVREDTNVFCVTVTGTEPFEYQWRKDGISIPGATENCHETGEGGVYTCVVTNRCDAAVSDGAELTIASRVTVSAVASDGGIRLGDTVTLAAAAARGLAPYAYLWSTGQTAASFDVTPTESTVYTVAATDALGQIATAEVNVVVAMPLTVQTRASAYILQPGESSTLTASVLTGGLVPFTFEWSTGETTASIVVAPMVNTTFFVTVTDALGQTGSASLTITINLETGDDQSGGDPPPADDPNDGDQPPGDQTDPNDGQDDTNGDDGVDQTGQDEPAAAAGLCPLFGFSMISLLVAGLCWTRGAGSRRRQ